MEGRDIFICGNSQKIIISDFVDTTILLVKPQTKMTANHHILDFPNGAIKEKIVTALITNDLKFIIIGFSDGVIRLYKYSDYSFVKEAKGIHTSTIRSMTLHPIHKNVLATVAEDGQLILWRIDTLTPFLYFTRDDYHDKNLRSLVLTEVEFSMDGNYICISDDFGSFSLFGIGPNLATSYQFTPPQQFFQFDYGKLVYDSQGNCIDEEQHVDPNTIRGQVTDFSLMPYSSLTQIVKTTNRNILQCSENRYTPETYKYRNRPEEFSLVNIRDFVAPVEPQPVAMMEDTPGEAEDDDVFSEMEDEVEPIPQQTHLTRNAANRMGITPMIEEPQPMIRQSTIINDESELLNSGNTLDTSLSSSEDSLLSSDDDSSEENVQQPHQDEHNDEHMEELTSSENNEEELLEENNEQMIEENLEENLEESNESGATSDFMDLLKGTMTSYPNWIHRVYSEYDMTCAKKHKTYFPNVGDQVYYFTAYHAQYLVENPNNITGSDNTLFVNKIETIEGCISFVRTYYDEVSNELYVSIDITMKNSRSSIDNIVFTASKTPFIFLVDAFRYNVEYVKTQKRVYYEGTSYRVDIENSNFYAMEGVKLVSSSSNVNVSLDDIDTDYKYHRDVENFPDTVKDMLVDKLKEVIKNPTYEIFSSPVDTRRFPSYILVCPFPIDLMTILRRVEKGEYYHTYAQVEWEFFKLVRNAVNFNLCDSVIGQQAIQLAVEFKQVFMRCREFVSWGFFVDLETQIKSFSIPQEPPTKKKEKKEKKEKRERKGDNESEETPPKKKKGKPLKYFEDQIAGKGNVLLDEDGEDDNQLYVPEDEIQQPVISSSKRRKTRSMNNAPMEEVPLELTQPTYQTQQPEVEEDGNDVENVKLLFEAESELSENIESSEDHRIEQEEKDVKDEKESDNELEKRIEDAEESSEAYVDMNNVLADGVKRRKTRSSTRKMEEIKNEEESNEPIANVEKIEKIEKLPKAEKTTKKDAHPQPKKKKKKRICYYAPHKSEKKQRKEKTEKMEVEDNLNESFNELQDEDSESELYPKRRKANVQEFEEEDANNPVYMKRTRRSRNN
ncbi:hypothetical protein EIN_315630 [Entamoeba invadens IP1]|uniref:Bromo domain-containing protein n=1 Tax=Entamoeba invadens IP1 TaxID=370355 RepID=A0A0A1TZE3_ENTIV|nr:hypothetical protein EIN_315630 [Entamoeba invadens IP1]ELP86934.1 hypothetical protein EIN_315630 [Entamoeba invadens IP1]|eukprot:XP_004253705.1 hypothetical protein EIN_315630 [Entamoeba invadens IP1]